MKATGSKESCWRKLHSFHVKRKESASLELKLFRGLSLLLWFICTIVDTIAFSGKLESFPAKIIFGSRAPLHDIFSIIYGSGSATFGCCYEIYPLTLLAVINFILALCNCSQRRKLITGLWLFKMIGMMTGAQVCYYNFRKLNGYDTKFSKATKYMLRHALIFTITMIFLMAPGLRAVYQNITGECLYNNSGCNLIELYEPLFNKTDFCADSYTQYIVAGEQLRILRNILFIHIGSYAMYNQSFLTIAWKWSENRFHYVMRVLLLFIFVFMSSASVIASVVPFEFPNLFIKLVFDGTEFAIFLIMLALLFLNLSCIFKLPEDEQMSEMPDITKFN